MITPSINHKTDQQVDENPEYKLQMNHTNQEQRKKLKASQFLIKAVLSEDEHLLPYSNLEDLVEALLNLRGNSKGFGLCYINNSSEKAGISNKEEMEEAVGFRRQQGFDFLKIWVLDVDDQSFVNSYSYSIFE